MKRYAAALLLAAGGLAMGEAGAELRAGAARASINPVEARLPAQLGGYGERQGKPATGTHDTIQAKAVIFEHDGARSALVALDVCHQPRALVERALAKAGVPGLAFENTLFVASHTHAGLEGMSMDPRNIANNPNIGIFDEQILEFVAERVAGALREAAGALRPVRAGVGAVTLPGMNRNRRHNDAPTDQDMTVLRLDTEDGRPYVVLVNYAAHGTIMTPEIMQVSGGWPGVMQRTVEELIGGDVTCLYVNGAEGDVAPAGYHGGSRWEMAEQYGRRAGIAAWRVFEAVRTEPVAVFRVLTRVMDLPPQRPAPDFLKIAGEEYQVDEAQLSMLLGVLFPAQAPLYGFRVNDFAMITYPGEPITAIGLHAKAALRAGGIRYPAVGALTNDLIGYILTAEEYAQSGYEVTASFYGDGLGAVVVAEAAALAAQLAE
jgi:hypothetical protein